MNDDDHKRFNYRICTALDMTKLGIVLDEMVAEKVLHPTTARTFRVQAASLLALIRSANDIAFGKDPSSPII